MVLKRENPVFFFTDMKPFSFSVHPQKLDYNFFFLMFLCCSVLVHMWIRKFFWSNASVVVNYLRLREDLTTENIHQIYVDRSNQICITYHRRAEIRKVFPFYLPCYLISNTWESWFRVERNKKKLLILIFFRTFYRQIT
jgi:hypothetical protein